MEAFKIKDTTTGLFSSGGISPKFSKRGKTWSGLAGLSSHLSMYMSGEYVSYPFIKRDIPESWFIVKLTEKGVEEFNAKEYKQSKIKK